MWAKAVWTAVLISICLVGDYLLHVDRRLLLAVFRPRGDDLQGGVGVGVGGVDASDRAVARLKLFQCLVDSATHCLVAGVSWIIVIASTSSISVTPIRLIAGLTLQSALILEVGLCGFLASAIDLDHFVEAGSFDLTAATSLTTRPFLHNTTIPIAVCLALVAAHKAFNFPRLERLGLLILVAFLSHHFRDSWRRGLWICPVASSLPVSYHMYLVLTVLLPHAVVLYMTRCCSDGKDLRSSLETV